MSRRGRSKKFHSLGDVLPSVVKGLRLEPVIQEQRLVNAWPEVVGEKVARHTRARSLDRRVLLVEVDSPSWMTQLVFLKPKIMRQLSTRAAKGALRDIRFVLGPDRP